jgi:hypothetical protein
LILAGDVTARLIPRSHGVARTDRCSYRLSRAGSSRVTDIASDEPRSQLVHMFPGAHCGVPTIVGHYLIQSVPIIHGLVVLDIAKPAQPVEVSRLIFDDVYAPHWTGWDAKARRLVVTGYDEHRLFMLKLDEASGRLALDAAFHDTDGKPGFSFYQPHFGDVGSFVSGQFSYLVVAGRSG